jgi:hypothetical protein
MKILNVAFTDVGRFNIADLNTARGAPTTLAVFADHPIAEAAELVVQKNPNLVVVLDNSDRVCGIIEPRHVQRMLAFYRQQPPNSFAEGILMLAQAVEQIPAKDSMKERPEPYWCVKGQHFTSDGPPCPYHP